MIVVDRGQGNIKISIDMVGNKVAFEVFFFSTIEFAGLNLIKNHFYKISLFVYFV